MEFKGVGRTSIGAPWQRTTNLTMFPVPCERAFLPLRAGDVGPGVASPPASLVHASSPEPRCNNSAARISCLAVAAQAPRAAVITSALGHGWRNFLASRNIRRAVSACVGPAYRESRTASLI